MSPGQPASPIAARFAEFAHALAANPARADHEPIKLYVLDTLAVMVAGARADSSDSMIRALGRLGSGKTATVAGVGKSASAQDAALLNGAFSHALELDDDHRVAVLHPGAVIVPAALAACELSRASGRTFLLATLAGYEIMCRLGLAYRGSHFEHGMHPTAIFGVFGAALAAGVGMGLDPAGLTRALGIAGTQASGLTEWRSDGSWIKRLHPGRAAQSGVLAAALAAEGFTGPATILEGEGGFFNAMGHGKAIDLPAITEALGTRLHALDTAIKPYPCCRFMHGALDLALEAHAAGVRPQHIESVDIRIYETGVLTYHQIPFNNVDAQFNVPYGVACALAQGSVSLSDYEAGSIGRGEILELCRRIHVASHQPYTDAYPDIYNVELVLRRRDGGVMSLHSVCPSGDPDADRYRDDPSALERETRRKVRRLLEGSGFGHVADALIESVDRLWEGADLDELLRCVGSRPEL
ncbi:MmgE/PrpD family protein [Alcaligenaceae bacterium]|nr:MmgE/PrpD family protein [Alcaligenaceae bacterium]